MFIRVLLVLQHWGEEKVRSIQFTLCTLLSVPCNVMFTVYRTLTDGYLPPYYENSFKYQLGTVLCSGVVSILLGW